MNKHWNRAKRLRASHTVILRYLKEAEKSLYFTSYMPRSNGNHSRWYGLTDTRVLTQTIIDYRQLSRSLDMFKFFRIADDSFCCLNERKMVHDRFSTSSFAKSGLKPKMDIAVLHSAKSACITVAITALLGWYRAIFVVNFNTPSEMLTTSPPYLYTISRSRRLGTS